ncbi:defensin-like protein 219 isoform X1 [Arabidopsis lyrata subsp. lyrata]|uniref:defensin-like protein 219 isoform X1 n=1 Tax=Arabidopsis lyrata subsp. lyrata TaxID=81972 RepID=UPI000A29AE31|nr:defensin-like protein 219 isoform X1 [Arabidopsis lyrata subsp. lyrata]|eukprot:XP_020884584.1 defensin-like protein 219 isoform X1 [Arabidopsis lyrata subsp. lyrata]
MKTIFFFITLAVLFSLCNFKKLFIGTSNIMTKSISEGKAQFSNPALSPDIDSADEHIAHSLNDMKIMFCQRCAYHCIEKKKNISHCENSICRCTLEDIL